MKLPVNFQDDRKIRAAFSWLTRIGAGPAFGSRPIGWYQNHQVAAIEILEKSGAEEVKLDKGVIKGRVGKHWIDLGSPSELYRLADKAARR